MSASPQQSFTPDDDDSGRACPDVVRPSSYARRSQTGAPGTERLGLRRAFLRGVSLALSARATGQEMADFRRYLQSIRRHAPLCAADELTMLRRMWAGDDAAVESLVCHLLWLVPALALQHEGQGMSLLQLVSVGNDTLVSAIRKYVGTSCLGLDRWMDARIRQALARELGHADGSTAKACERRASVTAAHVRLVQHLGRRPTIEELADASGQTVSAVREALHCQRREISWDALRLLETRRSPVVEPVPGPEGEFLHREALDAALATLPPRDARVLRLSFGIDDSDALTPEQIGALLGITRERVLQLQTRALKRLGEGHHTALREWHQSI